MKVHKSLLNFIRYSFLILFFYAGLTKLLANEPFYNNLYNSPLLPKSDDLISILAFGIPFFELGIALSLLKQQRLKSSLITIIALLSIYSLYIIYLLWWAPYQACSCGGVTSLLSWEQHLLLNILGIGLGSLGLYVLTKSQNLS